MVLKGFQNDDTKILGVSIILSDPYKLQTCFCWEGPSIICERVPSTVLFAIAFTPLLYEVPMALRLTCWTATL